MKVQTIYMKKIKSVVTNARLLLIFLVIAKCFSIETLSENDNNFILNTLVGIDICVKK